MSATLRVNQPAGEQVFEQSDLPVRFGSAGTSDVRLPGPAGNDSLLQIDQLDAVWFIQQLSTSSNVTLNGAPLSGSSRLHDGDRVEVFGTELVCALADSELSIQIDWAGSSYRTTPPVAPETAASETEEIVAAQFRRSLEQAPAAPEAQQRWKFVVAAALIALLGIGGLLFTSQSIRFETVPENPSKISISGGWYKLPLGDRFLLRSGRYRVLLQSDGYYDLEKVFEVGKGESQTLRIIQRPLPGIVLVHSSPPVEADVTFDGESIGKAPLTVSGLEPGKYTIRVEAERYLPWEGVIDVIGLAKEQSITAELVPAFGKIRVLTEPTGALVYSGREALGTTPAVVEVLEGRQAINVILDGYKPEDVNVAVMANTLTELEPLVLEKANGILNVKTRPSGANITVDGKYRGQSPVRLSLAPGQEYVIGLSKSGYGRTSRSVKVGAATGQVLDVDLAARLGEITLSITPPDSEVFVNGRAQKAGTTQLKLPAAPQRVEVRRSGYSTWSETLTPRPGFPQRVRVRLKTNDQVRVAGIKQTLTSTQGPVLRYIDPGSYQMGASRREQGRRANETLRNVTLTRGYYIGTREITNREFLMFKADHDAGADTAVSLAGDKNPVVNVSWAEAAAYCNWLSDKDGLTPVYEEKFGSLAPRQPLPDGYRLPTEAEWVWAARYQGGLGALKFPWGDAPQPPKESGNFADQSARALVATVLPGYDDGYAATAPVASFKANATGIYDFGGNAAEWVHDFYEVYTPDSTRVWTDPEGPLKAKHNVIRGSSWRHAGLTPLRMSFRDFGSDRRDDVGFRIARTAP